MASVEESGVDRWFFGGGAEHTPESARRLAYTATGGAEGVGGVSDLRVRPLTIPGQGVRVAVGSALIRSRYIGGETQTYQGAAYREQLLDIVPNETQSTRTDMVVFRVEDPHAAGSTYPTPAEGDIVDEQYIYARVISGVPATAKRIQEVPGHENDSAITLARVTLPAGIGTIDNVTGTITDLREIAQPRTLTEVRAYQATGVETPELIESTGGETWPHFAEVDGVLSVDIPDWATVMKIVYTISGYQFSAGSPARGRFWCQVGRSDNPDKVETQHSVWAGDRPGPVRVSDTKTIPKELRGTRQKFYPRARRDAGTAAQGLKADWATNVDFTVTFQEVRD